MKIPEKIKIGAYDVKVQYTKNLMTDKSECGNFSPRVMEIRIDPDICEQLQSGVLLHEIIEGITDIYHITCLKENHTAIEQISEALHQLIRDNPGLMGEQ